MKIACIAVDDEPLALDIMRDYIKQVDFLEYKAGFDNPVEALGYLKKNPIDLLFLDIQMSKLTGIQMIEVMKNKPHIILTTAYEEYALKGYELDITDYLLKPISFERFIQSIDKAYEKILLEKKQTTVETSVIYNPKESFIFAKVGSSLKKIEFSSILYIEGMGEYLKIVTENDNMLTLQNFQRIGNALPADNFVRVHKSYMVSIGKIDRIEHGRIYMKDKIIPVSDKYRESFYQLLEKKSI